MVKRWWVLPAVILPMLLWRPAAAEPTGPVVINFGVGPQQSAGELAKRWTPVFEYLSEKTGYTILFRTAKDIPTYQRQCKDGAYDMIYINPYHYATLCRPGAGYEVFAQEKDARLVGVIVVSKDSPYRRMQDLDGRELAFPARAAVTAAVLPLQYFREHKVAVKENYVMSHDSVYRAVAKKLYAAGGGEQRTFDSLDPEVRNKLRVLWTAPPLPPFVFAAHPRVPMEAVKRVRAAMLQMDRDPAAAPLLRAINFKGIAPARDAEYDVVRKMHIKVPGETSTKD